MKYAFKLLLIGLFALSARADILRLRDGRMFTGLFLGATRTEIWFQHDTPGDFIGTGAYPVEQVESLTFGPAARQSNAQNAAPLDKAPFSLPFIPVDRPASACTQPRLTATR